MILEAVEPGRKKAKNCKEQVKSNKFEPKKRESSFPIE
jgi:hypothetical protein